MSPSSPSSCSSQAALPSCESDAEAGTKIQAMASLLHASKPAMFSVDEQVTLGLAAPAVAQQRSGVMSSHPSMLTITRQHPRHPLHTLQLSLKLMARTRPMSTAMARCGGPRLSHLPRPPSRQSCPRCSTSTGNLHPLTTRPRSHCARTRRRSMSCWTLFTNCSLSTRHR